MGRRRTSGAEPQRPRQFSAGRKKRVWREENAVLYQRPKTGGMKEPTVFYNYPWFLLPVKNQPSTKLLVSRCGAVVVYLGTVGVNTKEER
jgi:hypothetical protein